MKKLKVILMLICVNLCMNACKKTEKKETQATKAPGVSSNSEKEETKKTDNETQKKNENVDKDEEKKTENNSSPSENVIKEAGLFLGLDGSNFAVVITSNKDGGTKQLNLQLSKDVDIEKSNVEIGDSVNIEYTVDSTDNKILKKIYKTE